MTRELKLQVLFQGWDVLFLTLLHFKSYGKMSAAQP